MTTGLNRLREAWPAIVGTDIAAHSKPVQVLNGALLILTDSSGWSQQVSLLTGHIIPAVSEIEPTIDRLRFRVDEQALLGAPNNALTSKTRREIFASFEEYLRIFDRTARLFFTRNVAGIPVSSFTELTEEQGQKLLEAIEMAGPLENRRPR